MGFRQIYIKEAKKIYLQNNCVCIEKKDIDQIISFPLEDIDLIFVEDPNTVLTSRLITESSSLGISIILCNNIFLPSAQTIPINGYYLQPNMLKLQLELTQFKKNKFWENIVRGKIRNQMEVINYTNCDMVAYNKLNNYLDNVKNGDERNMEGQAAKEYFKSLFGENFIRFNDSPISDALNYGYSVLTGAVIRTVSFLGLNDNIGIWHHSSKNSNNLSCDLVECFRPVVDFYVFNNLNRLVSPLPMEIRKGLLNLLNYRVIFDNKKYQLSYAIELVVREFVDYLKTQDFTNVILPIFYKNEESSDE